MKLLRRVFSGKLIACSMLFYWTWCLGPSIPSMIRLYLSRKAIRGTKYPLLITAKAVTKSLSVFRQHEKRENKSTQVPKLLHQMWKVEDVTTMPRAWRDALTKCNKVHKGKWKAMFWTDETIRNFILERFPWFINKFDSYRYPIQRVDVARYFILYYYGGVYLDLDISCPQALDTLLDTMDEMEVSSIIPMTNPIGFSNDVMFATKKHPFFHELTKFLMMYDGWYGSEYLTIMFTTGPMYLSSIYQDMPDSIKNEIGILHPELYTPQKGATYKFFRHMKGQSWHGKDAMVVKSLWNHTFVLLISSFGLIVTMVMRRRFSRHKRQLRLRL